MKLSTMISLLLVPAILPQGLCAEEVQQEEKKTLLSLDKIANLTVKQGDKPGKPIIGLKIGLKIDHPPRLSKDLLAPLKPLKHLRSLEIEGTEIDADALASLADLTELQKLDLTILEFTDVTLAGLKDLTRLRMLVFVAWEISDDGLASLVKLTHLESLTMLGAKKMKITDAGLAHLANLVQLRKLSLHESQVSDKGLAHLRRMTKMRALELSQTKIQGPGLAHLAGMDDLEELNLTSTTINNAGLEHLPAAKRLRWVNVRFTEVRPRGLTACPGGKIKLEVDGLTGQLRNATTNEAIGPQLRHSPRGDGAKIVCWAFSPDGKLLATGSGYKNERGDGESMGEIRVWDVATGKLLAERERGMGYVHGLAFRKDSKTLVFLADIYRVDGA